VCPALTTVQYNIVPPLCTVLYCTAICTTPYLHDDGRGHVADEGTPIDCFVEASLLVQIGAVQGQLSQGFPQPEK